MDKSDIFGFIVLLVVLLVVTAGFILFGIWVAPIITPEFHNCGKVGPHSHETEEIIQEKVPSTETNTQNKEEASTIIIEEKKEETVAEKQETASPKKEKYTSLGTYKITAYCGCAKCCGKTDGITASGTHVTAGRTIAAPPEIPFGTKISINGHIYTVEDRGGAIKGKRIDIYFNTHEEALQWGVQYLEVFKVVE